MSTAPSIHLPRCGTYQEHVHQEELQFLYQRIPCLFKSKDTNVISWYFESKQDNIIYFEKYGTLTIKHITDMLNCILPWSLISIGKSTFLWWCFTTLCICTSQAERNLRSTIKRWTRSLAVYVISICIISQYMHMTNYSELTQSYPASSTATTPARVYKSA